MKYDVRKLLLDTLRIVPYTPGDTAGISDSLLAKAVTADENLHSLGYMLAPQDIVRLAVSPSLDSLFKEVQKTVPEMKASPMYPDFPGQVMKMSEAEFRFHQVLHYFSTYDLEWITGIPVSKGWLPDVKSTPKTEKDEVLLPYRVIELIPEDEVYGTAAKRILLRRTSLKMLGIQRQYSCAFRLARHKNLSFCGAMQFCESHYSFRQYRKLREYLMYFRSFLCRMGG